MTEVAPKGKRNMHSWKSDSTILLVEDDPVCRLFCRQNLSKTGSPVIETESGKEAIRLALLHRPGFVLIDLNLPDLSAYQVLDRLRDAWPVMPGKSRVIGISADHSRQVARDMLNAGCQQVLFKPFSAESLMSAISYPGEVSSGPAPIDLRCAFLRELPQSLLDLDNAISRMQWRHARHILHRFGGAASFAGFGQLAGLVRALRWHIRQPGDCVALADSYLAFLQCASEVLNEGPGASTR